MEFNVVAQVMHLFLLWIKIEMFWRNLDRCMDARGKLMTNQKDKKQNKKKCSCWYGKWFLNWMWVRPGNDGTSFKMACHIWPSCGLVNVVLAWTTSGKPVPMVLHHQSQQRAISPCGMWTEVLVYCVDQNWTRQILQCGHLLNLHNCDCVRIKHQNASAVM